MTELSPTARHAAFNETYMLDSYAGPWCFCKVTTLSFAVRYRLPATGSESVSYLAAFVTGYLRA